MLVILSILSIYLFCSHKAWVWGNSSNNCNNRSHQLFRRIYSHTLSIDKQTSKQGVSYYNSDRFTHSFIAACCCSITRFCSILIATKTKQKIKRAITITTTATWQRKEQESDQEERLALQRQRRRLPRRLQPLPQKRELLLKQKKQLSHRRGINC